MFLVTLHLWLLLLGVRHIEHSIISDKLKNVQAEHDQGGKPGSVICVLSQTTTKSWPELLIVGLLFWRCPRNFETPASSTCSISSSSRLCPLNILEPTSALLGADELSSIATRGVRQIVHSNSCPSLINVQALQGHSAGSFWDFLWPPTPGITVLFLHFLVPFLFLVFFPDFSAMHVGGATWGFLILETWKSSEESSSIQLEAVLLLLGPLSFLSLFAMSSTRANLIS